MPNPEKNSSLYVKSFFAASIPEAMEQARRELGSDALLLNSREAPPEARHLGEYEVVFGTWPDTAGHPPLAASPADRKEELHLRIHELRQMMSRIRPALPAGPGGDAGVAFALVEAGLELDLADSIERAVRRRMTKGAVLDIARPHAAASQENQSLLAATIDELSSRFEVQPEIGRITALIGPPGAGKTTTLVKLAISQCLAKGRAVQLATTDTVRIGAADQLRTYATILGVPFHAVESTVALGQIVDAIPANTNLLIDTPGFSAALQQEFAGELIQFLSRRQEIDTQLVLTASMDRNDLRTILNRFQPFAAQKLIFTRIDEITSYGAVFSGAARTRKPVSFLCHGQSIPEDIQAASKDPVVDSLVRQLPDALQAVA